MSTKLQSGLPYKLSQLLSGDLKIIIPDLQRDYCWGDKTHGVSKSELVSGFIESLFGAYSEWEKQPTEKKNPIQLGMIYAYENPVNHVQLCDGQQRITTLFLLIGMLYKVCKKEELKNCLISKAELDDDKEPYLQYAIRESTLYFLSDLVCEFFLNGITNVEKIKESKWYFSEYDFDPTIQSMLSAMQIIEDKLKGKSNEFLNVFYNFLINHVNLLYFDMVNRQHGEEMFVVINTTGEPLTPTENIKPILIGNIKDPEERKTASEIWEEWEKWFWKNKLEGENEADIGLKDFFIWYWQIKLRQESDWSSGKKERLNPIILFKEKPIRKNEKDGMEYYSISNETWERAITISEVNLYFEQLKKIWEYFSVKSFKKIIQQINKNASNPRDLSQEQILRIILPLLEFMVKISNKESDHFQFLRRLRKNYFDSLKEWEERNNNYIDWRYVFQIIEKSSIVDDCFHTNIPFEQIGNVKVPKSNWYNNEERLKTELKKLHKAEIEEWEDHPDFMGDLSPLFNVSDNSTDINVIQIYFKSYNDFISAEGNLKNEISLLRICCDFYPDWFSIDGGFRCIEQIQNYKIFNKKWFFNIWQIFTENEEYRLENIKQINKLILSQIIENKCFIENEEINSLDLTKEISIDISKIKEFEKERSRNWEWSDGYAVASIYYWMYLEKLYNKSQNLSISNGLCQIGIRMWNCNELDETVKYSFCNIKVATHYSRGRYANYNYDFMKKINELQKNKQNEEIKEEFEKIHQTLLQELS